MELEPLKEIPFSIFSPIGLVGAAMFANVFPLIPEEIFLMSFGYLSNTKPETFPFFITVTFLIIGLLIIDIIVYYLAKRGSKIIYFILRILNLDLKNKKEFIKKHINKIIFISRFLIQLRVVGPISAAIVKMPIKKFLMIDFLALVIYVPAFMGIGYYFRESIERILSGTGAIIHIASGVIVLALIIGLMSRLKTMLLIEISGKSIKEKIKSTIKNTINGR